jgi:NTE family protein
MGWAAGDDRAARSVQARGSAYGLVLTGGGARAAYQVGAIRALAEISGSRRLPFTVLAGMSAGAINAAALAAHADDLPGAAARLAAVWGALTPDRVYRTEARELVALGARWIGLLTGTRRDDHLNYLLDTTPLRQLLNEVLELDRLPRLFRSGLLRGVAVSATDYATGTAVSFFDGDPRIGRWVRSLRIGERARLTLDHVMASAAIPVIFPPVRIGDALYGDGCIRMLAPLSPAVHLGADRIVAVSVRYRRSPGETATLQRASRSPSLPIAEIAGTLMNALFHDAFELDVGRLERLNQLLRLVPDARRVGQPLREIPLLVLRPSQDIGALAADVHVRLPGVLRHLLSGIGAHRANDLLSYLAFEPVYVRMLMNLGYRDTMERRQEIAAFLRAPAARDACVPPRPAFPANAS